MFHLYQKPIRKNHIYPLHRTLMWSLELGETEAEETDMDDLKVRDIEV